MGNAAKEYLKRIHLLRIPIVFLKRVFCGFRVYSKLLSQYEEGTVFLGTAWRGIGDYYICASYLPAWLKKNKVENFLFLTPSGGEKKTVELFPTTEKNTFLLPREEDYSPLLFFRAFLGTGDCRFYNFHHQQNFPASEDCNISRGLLQGFRGLNMVDFYLNCGFSLPEETEKEAPVFSRDKDRVKRYFLEYDLQPGRTVMIAPYSTGLEEYLPPEPFWEEIVEQLKAEGYSVCTNCSGEERPISGTQALCIPLSEIVLFLDMAGGFIGIRSGLCDVISTADSKKIILHTHEAKWWPQGRSLTFTGLAGMGLCTDALELELGLCSEAIIQEVLSVFSPD